MAMATENAKADIANIENVTSASEPHFDPTLEKINVKQGDDALQFTIENGSINWTKEDERAVLWKIDLRLVPLVSCLPHFTSTMLIPSDVVRLALGLQRYSSLWNCSDFQNDHGLGALQDCIYRQCGRWLHFGSQQVPTFNYYGSSRFTRSACHNFWYFCLEANRVRCRASTLCSLLPRNFRLGNFQRSCSPGQESCHFSLSPPRTSPALQH